jgi:ABC-type lipoprotein release transport system permease subunit
MFKPLGFFTKTAFLFLLRSGRSTAVLSLMILSALAVGINDAMVRNSVSLYSGHISGFGLPPELKPESLLVEGVDGVLKHVALPGMFSHEERFETAALIGVDPDDELKHTALWKKATRGTYLKKGERTVLLSESLANRLNVQPGDRLGFRTGPEEALTWFTVAGLYSTGIDQLDLRTVCCSLDMMPAQGETWSAAIFLKEGVDPEAVIASYRRTLASPYPFKSWAEQMPDLRQLIELNYLSMSLVTVLVFGVVSLGIACGFVIFILKNFREYGIMKAMGTTPGELAYLIFTQVVLMNWLRRVWGS